MGSSMKDSYEQSLLHKLPLSVTTEIKTENAWQSLWLTHGKSELLSLAVKWQ